MLLALARGWLCRCSCRLRGVRFRAGRNLRVFGRLNIQGPGEVVFGANVVVNDKVTPWTYSKDARIVIGDNVNMGRTRFGCARAINIGRDCIVGGASIADTDFHSIRSDRRSGEAPIRVAPVHIDENVWIAEQTGILPGAKIGRNSVVSFGAVCGREYPPDVVIVGNPARPVMQVPVPDAPGSSTEAVENVPNGSNE